MTKNQPMTREQKKSFRLLLNALKDANCYAEDVAFELSEMGYDANKWDNLWIELTNALCHCHDMMEEIGVEELTNGKIC